jgi:hypothetical protein
MRTITLALLMLCSSAWADVVGEAKGPRGVSILLYDAPCQIKMPDTKPRFQVDFLEPDGRVRWAGCWRVENEAIQMIWSDGDVSLLPAGVFNFGATKRNVPNT